MISRSESHRPFPHLLTGLAAVVVMTLSLAACTDNTAGPTTAPGVLTVSSTDSECTISAAEAPSGKVTFTVTNDGSKVTEFYLLAEDGLRIVGEVENISPGISRDLVITAQPGKYFTACKPGMVGDGIRADFTVTDSGTVATPSGDDQALLDQANAQYASYVKDQTEQLLAKTRQFAALYIAGDDDAARTLYPNARVHWERIETVAESFGDLDPRMDLREADLEPGQTWTGWHAIEKDLWAPQGYTAKTAAERKTLADQLVADTQELHDRTRTMTFTADQIGNGAKGLLDEVATGKVTGEEEAWSHTDLWDFQANVDGARVMWQGLQPLLQKKDAALDTEIAGKMTALQTLLDKHKVGDGFTTYDQLSAAEVKELSDAVNALAEPMSKITAAIL